jgi:serine/threonine protein kinase
METEKYYFFVMEHAAGGELSKYICDRGKLDEKKSCRFFRQLITAVEYMHKMGYAHRDIKPSNILLKDDFELKLIDFGLGNIYQTGDLLETPCGSPCYAAPELVTGKAYNGIGVDIWSSGITLFAMLCGYLPFNDESRNELFRKIAACEYVMPEFFSPLAKDFIRKLFVANPKKRLSIEEIKAHQWFNLYKEEVSEQKPLDDYATETEIVALTCHYMHSAEAKLRQMLRDKQANKFTCCYKLFMLKRQHKRLTKEDLAFIQQRRIGDWSTDLTLHKGKSATDTSKDKAGFKRSDSRNSGTVKLPSIRGKEQTGTMTEILAKGVLKQVFADKLKMMHRSVESNRRNESFDKSKNFGARSLTEDHKERSNHGTARPEKINHPGETFVGSVSRDGSPAPQTPGVSGMKTEGDRRESHRSRQVLRFTSQNSNGVTIKNPLSITKSKVFRDASREKEGKQKLTINTTWEGPEPSVENSKELPHRSISRQSVSISRKGPSTPNSQVGGSKQLMNIKSMIKHIISTGDKSNVARRTDRSKERSEKLKKPAFFNNISTNGPIKLKGLIPRDTSFTSQYPNQSAVKSFVSPKSAVVPSKKQTPN